MRELKKDRPAHCIGGMPRPLLISLRLYGKTEITVIGAHGPLLATPFIPAPHTRIRLIFPPRVMYLGRLSYTFCVSMKDLLQTHTSHTGQLLLVIIVITVLRIEFHSNSNSRDVTVLR